MLPVASRGRVLLKFDLNSRPHLVEWRRVLRFLVLLLDDWLCLCQNLCKLYCLYDGYDYLRLHRAVGFLSLSDFIVQMVDCFLKLQPMFFWYCIGWYCYLFSSWFSRLNFTEKFRVCFCSPYFIWGYLFMYVYICVIYIYIYIYFLAFLYWWY